MKLIKAIIVCVTLLFITSCGSLGDAKQAIEDIEARIEDMDKKLDEATKEIEHLKSSLAEFKDESFKSVEKLEQYDRVGRTWLYYLKLVLYVLGVIAVLKMLGKPLARVSSCLLLKYYSPKPRQVMPNRQKGSTE